MSTLDVSLIFKLAAVAILMIVIDRVLKATGKDDYAVILNLAAVILILLVIVSLLNQLFTAVRTMFQF